MMHQPYADAAYYTEVYGGSMIPADEIDKCLKRASRHMDSLTYNRIAGQGISSLTEFQQEIIRECCCEMAEFEFENADLIESALQNYSINGVSMNFGNSWNVKVISGVAVRADTYGKLSQTGLCSSILKGW